MKDFLSRLLKFSNTFIRPIVILGLCAVGFFNLGLFNGFKADAKLSFAAIALAYSIFHLDGAWNWIKKRLGLKKVKFIDDIAKSIPGGGIPKPDDDG